MKAETHKAVLARLRARRDAIRAGVKSHRPTKTPFAFSFSKESEPKPKPKKEGENERQE